MKATWCQHGVFNLGSLQNQDTLNLWAINLALRKGLGDITIASDCTQEQKHSFFHGLSKFSQQQKWIKQWPMKIIL